MRTYKTNHYWLIMLPFLFVACTPQQPAAPAAPPEPAFTAKPYGNLSQVMRTVPFPSSNVIFDAQSNDPVARQAEAKAAAEKGGDKYAGTYGGWAGVEEAAIAISETANLIMLPGRVCSNGLPVPIEREDYKQFVQGLVDAGDAALKAAQSRNQDNMVDVSGTVAEACAACHAVYRDQPEPKQRCTP